MPRFESDDEFWEIERDGRVLRTRSGRLGDPGSQQVHTALFEDEAMREFDNRIERKLEEGFRPVEQPSDLLDELDPRLSRAVVDALDPAHSNTDAGQEALRVAWSVLGDWLSARGDVRGELINIDENLTIASGLGAQRLYARRDLLLREWIPRWFGEYAKLDAIDRPIHLAWDHGFIAAARIGTEPGALDMSRWRLGLRDLVPVLATLLAHPMSFSLQQLRIAELDPQSRRDLAKALPLLRDTTREALIRLELGGVSRGRWVRDETGAMRQREVLARIGWLHHLAHPDSWAPRLAALRIIGRELQMLPELPQLRVLELMTPKFDEELRAWLIGGPWPQLERLWLRSTDDPDPWAGEHAELLDELLDSLRRAPLRQLGLQGKAALDRLTWRAISEPLELRELRLFGVTESMVQPLLAAADYFEGIDRIVLEEPQVNRGMVELQARYGARMQRCNETFGLVGEATGSHLYESLFDSADWKA
jgi:predicted DNA-binding WGR domain protein